MWIFAVCMKLEIPSALWYIIKPLRKCFVVEWEFLKKVCESVNVQYRYTVYLNSKKIIFPFGIIVQMFFFRKWSISSLQCRFMDMQLLEWVFSIFFFLCRLIANHVQQDLLVTENTKYAPKIIVYISVLTFKLNCNINNFKSECLLGHLTRIDPWKVRRWNRVTISTLIQ